MTPQEIDNLKKTLPYYYKDMTDEQLVLDFELSWRSYCNSCLIYGQSYLIEQNGKLVYKRQGWSCYDYFTHNKKEIISKERALEIFNEQREDFLKNCKVHKGVYTDSEGCSYNSVDWK